MTSVGVAGLNAVYTAGQQVGLDAIQSAAKVPWIDVILAVEAKNLPAGLGLDPGEWLVVQEMHAGEGKQGVSAAFRRSTMKVTDYWWRLGVGKNSDTLDRWILTVAAKHKGRNGQWKRRARRYRVSHMVPMRAWRYWPAQVTKVLAGRWTVIYADWNRLSRAVQPAASRSRRGARALMTHIVGVVIAPGIRTGRRKTWRTHGLDHDITAVELIFGKKEKP